MSRNPGESTERWNARASAEYNAAWDALGAERRGKSVTANPETVWPAWDAGYDDAMDRLAVADCERGESAIALDRERRTDDRDRTRAGGDHRELHCTNDDG